VLRIRTSRVTVALTSQHRTTPPGVTPAGLARSAMPAYSYADREPTEPGLGEKDEP